jgi:hypothetical protein
VNVPRIGIVGAGGDIGRRLVAALRRPNSAVHGPVHLVLAGRDPRSIPVPPALDGTAATVLTTQGLDARDLSALARFAAPLDAVVSAIGPSHDHALRAASTVTASGAHYVDVGGPADAQDLDEVGVCSAPRGDRTALLYAGGPPRGPPGSSRGHCSARSCRTGPHLRGPSRSWRVGEAPSHGQARRTISRVSRTGTWNLLLRGGTDIGSPGSWPARTTSNERSSPSLSACSRSWTRMASPSPDSTTWTRPPGTARWRGTVSRTCFGWRRAWGVTEGARRLRDATTALAAGTRSYVVLAACNEHRRMLLRAPGEAALAAEVGDRCGGPDPRRAGCDRDRSRSSGARSRACARGHDRAGQHVHRHHHRRPVRTHDAGGNAVNSAHRVGRGRLDLRPHVPARLAPDGRRPGDRIAGTWRRSVPTGRRGAWDPLADLA